MPAPFITVPTSACIASVALTMKRVVGVTQSPFTLEEQFFQWQGEQWAIEFTLPPIVNKRVAIEWKAFGMKCEGGFATFLLGDPSAKTPLGVATGSPLVDGSGQEGKTLVTKGWTPNTPKIYRAGDYLQLGADDNAHLHMVVEDADSDALGHAILTINPAMRESPANNSVIVTQNARGVFRMVDDSFSWSVRQGPVYQMSFRAQEVVNA